MYLCCLLLSTYLHIYSLIFIVLFTTQINDGGFINLGLGTMLECSVFTVSVLCESPRIMWVDTVTRLKIAIS